MLVCVGSLTFSSALAGGFQLWEQDASGIGDNHAGSAAEALNAGTEFYNPAGMTNLPHFVTSLGLTYIPLDINFTGTVGFDNTSTTAESKTNNYVPNFHLVYPINSRVAIGFGLTVPYGLATEYPKDNPIAAAATKTDLKTVNLNPNLAVAVTRYLSVAAGFDVLYGQAEYDSVDPTSDPVTNINNKLSDWAYGWNAGALIYFTSHTRVGVSYRSQIELNGKGTSFDEGADILNDDLLGTIELPPTWNFSFYSDVNKRISVLFSAYYTQWSVFDDLILQNVSALGQKITIGIHENYRNTVALAAGVHILLLKNLMLKLGVGHDQTPTQNNLRDVRLPDSDRYSLAMGLHWQTSRTVVLDFGWMHFFADAAAVNNSQAQLPTNPFSQVLGELGQTIGTSRSSVNVVGLQLSWTPNAAG